jgi:hypothetical protein
MKRISWIVPETGIVSNAASPLLIEENGIPGAIS